MQQRHERYATRMREANLTGKQIVAKRPTYRTLEEICNRVEALEESVAVLRGVEERIRVLEAEHEALLFDTPKRVRSAHGEG